jgi:hypothetical protein
MAKKMTSQAKRETYLKNLETGLIHTKTMKVLNYIRSYELSSICNTYDMRQCLNMPHQTLTAIISNLLDLGSIRISEEIKKGNNTYSSYRFVPNIEDQIRIANERKKEKFENWLKQGVSEYSELMTEVMFNLIKSQLTYNKMKRNEIPRLFDL